MTPKQAKRTGRKSQSSVTEMEQKRFASPALLDERFDEPSQADREFTRWRFPERDND